MGDSIDSIDPSFCFHADTWEKPLTCPSSLFVRGTLFSQQHIYHL